MSVTIDLRPAAARGLRQAAKRLGISFEEYVARLKRGIKWCGDCRSWLPFSAFHRNATRRVMGLSNYCRACMHRRRKQRRAEQRAMAAPALVTTPAPAPQQAAATRTTSVVHAGLDLIALYRAAKADPARQARFAAAAAETQASIRRAIERAEEDARPGRSQHRKPILVGRLNPNL
jgi:hypothetical protein